MQTQQHLIKPGIKRALMLTVASLLITACANKPPTAESNYADAYLQALTVIDGAPAKSGEELTPFISAISDLKQPNFKQGLEQVYAEELYFNDTLHSYTTRDELVEYLVATAERVESTVVEVQDIVTAGNDYYLRWLMTIEFEVSGQKKISKSIGMTHIRLNQQGQVVLHQDYWDNVQGLYRHIPFVGYVISKVQARL